MAMPIAIYMTAFAIFILSKKAKSAAVQAPVIGKGIATNSVNPK